MLDDRATRYAAILLATSLFSLLAHAFIPLEKFIQRGDDAFYYFGVAANYPRLGFWSFDGIHSTNGVQPLWAILLSAIAQGMSWVGVTDRDALARVFVAVAALFHFVSVALLFELLRRHVSTGTAIAAAGAFLFPLGIVWVRVWGMENGLYAVTLLASMLYFHRVFLPRRTVRTAIVLGILLGLTALSRLNAVVFAGFLLLAALQQDGRAAFPLRLRRAAAAGFCAGAIVLVYLLANYFTTGHFQPISAEAKALGTRQYLDSLGIDSRLSLAFVKAVFDQAKGAAYWFVTSRAVDGLWIAGSRIVFDENSAVPPVTFLAILSVLLAAPALAGGPARWIRFLKTRLSSLLPFWYLAGFGAADALLTAALYPLQMRYAATRWWLVADEIVLTVVMATVAIAALGHVGRRLVSARLVPGITLGVVALLAAFGTGQMLRFYWSGTDVQYDWNRSWDDASYRGAMWLADHAPPDALVGSWNAGIVGYYAEQRVVNLDGLINDYELLESLEAGTLSEYVREKRISYLSDMQPAFAKLDDRARLELTEVYRRPCPEMQQDYVIYRVNPPS